MFEDDPFGLGGYDYGGYNPEDPFGIGGYDGGTGPDPYADWGGGAGGDGSDGSGDSGSSWLNQLLGLGKGLNPFSGPGGGGGLNLMTLLAGLGGLGTTLNQNNASKDAVRQLQDAANKSNDFAMATIGDAKKNYQPYMDAGTGALTGMQNMIGNSNLADKFGPIGGSERKKTDLYGAIPMRELAQRKGK